MGRVLDSPDLAGSRRRLRCGGEELRLQRSRVDALPFRAIQPAARYAALLHDVTVRGNFILHAACDKAQGLLCGGVRQALHDRL